jgi:hypothetical protein
MNWLMMCRLRAPSASDADLVRALAHHHVHDVSHADAGHQQGECANEPHEDLDAQADLQVLPSRSR